MSHQVAAGVGRKFGRLAASNSPIHLPLHRIRALWLGLPGCGKSNLLQSCPDMYIFHLDRTSTTNQFLQAGLFPRINDFGQCLDEKDQPLILQWEHVLQRIKVLREMAETKDPQRPRAVGFDSLSSMMMFIRDYAVRNAAMLKLKSSGAATWKDLDGKAAWDFVYSHITETIEDLYSLGYGVHVTGHVVNARIPVGEDRVSFAPELTVTDGFWKRFYFGLEMVALVVKRRVTITEQIEVKYQAGGKEVTTTRPQERVKDEVTVYVDKVEESLQGVLKKRVDVPPTVIPPTGGWEVFNDAYEKAASRQKESST